MDPRLAVALSVFIISYSLLASERINRTVVVALAFLVVVFSACTPSESRSANHENALVSANLCLYTAKVGRSNRLEPMVSFFNRERESSR
jgi:hypothetical protein